MKIKILLVLLGSIIFLQSCSQKVKTIAVASSDQKTYYDGSVISENRHVVTISLYDKIKLAKDRTIFEIVVQVRGEVPVKISRDNISVIFNGNSSAWTSKKINIQSSDEFIKYLEDAYYIEEARIIGNIIRIVDMLTTNAEMNQMSNMMGSGGGMSSFGGKTTTTEDKALEAQVANLEQKLISAINKINLMREEIDQLKMTVPDLVLKQWTILPGNSYNGIVVCETSEMTPETEGTFNVVVTIDGEKHEFTFEHSS